MNHEPRLASDVLHDQNSNVRHGPIEADLEPGKDGRRRYGVRFARRLGMQRILAAIDGSPRRDIVLAAAARVAHAQGAKIILFRAVSLPTELPHDAYLMAPADVTKLLVAHATEEVEAAARTIEPGLVERIHVQVGTPWQAICDAARADAVDLIVIGAHGYAGIDKLIGTTAAKVVNHADRSVLVARAVQP